MKVLYGCMIIIASKIESSSACRVVNTILFYICPKNSCINSRTSLDTVFKRTESIARKHLLKVRRPFHYTVYTVSDTYFHSLLFPYFHTKKNAT